MLGGQIGAMSKQGLGSTFWFTIPLILPEAAPSRRPSALRRTASWSCRDAFTDGHYDHSVGPRARLRRSRLHRMCPKSYWDSNPQKPTGLVRLRNYCDTSTVDPARLISGFASVRTCSQAGQGEAVVAGLKPCVFSSVRR